MEDDVQASALPADAGSSVRPAWPRHFPEGCPPEDAIPADGEVFRLVKHDPVQAKDLESHTEAGKLPKAPPCLRAGLSVFRTQEDAIHQRELFSFLGDRVASARLRAEVGKTKLTPGKQPSHTTWWPYEHVNRQALFTVVLVFR